MKTMKYFVLALVIVGSQALCGDDAVIVEVKDFQFHPREVTVKAGATIRWVNKEQSGEYHSVWFKPLGEPPPAHFFLGESYERTFNELGDYPYICEAHEWYEMKGIVHVVRD